MSRFFDLIDAMDRFFDHPAVLTLNLIVMCAAAFDAGLNAASHNVAVLEFAAAAAVANSIVIITFIWRKA